MSYRHHIALQIIPSDNLSLYLLRVEDVLKTEADRVKECLDISTMIPLVDTVEKVMITEVSQQILHHPDFAMLIEQERIEDLKRISDLFKRVDTDKIQSMNQYRLRWRNNIQAKGEAMLNDEELAKKGFKAIEDFIGFRSKSVALVKRVFPNEHL